jgi:hypothetical protein
MDPLGTRKIAPSDPCCRRNMLRLRCSAIVNTHTQKQGEAAKQHRKSPHGTFRFFFLSAREKRSNAGVLRSIHISSQNLNPSATSVPCSSSVLDEEQHAADRQGKRHNGACTMQRAVGASRASRIALIARNGRWLARCRHSTLHPLVLRLRPVGRLFRA